MHYKEPEDRNQTQLFWSLDSLISPNHPVRIIDFLIEKIVNENPKHFIYKGQSRIGQKSYSPKTFLKLYIYGYLNSISTTRRLETETTRNIEVKWLLGNLQPDFKTIADYRRDNKEQINFVTSKIRHFLKDNKYISGKYAVIDGTKIKANAQKEMYSDQKIQQLLSTMANQMNKYLEMLDINDEQRDEDLKKEENKELYDKIAQLQKKIEQLENLQENLNSRENNYINATDADAMLVKSRQGKIPGYNVETIVDSENMMIMHQYLSDSETDMREIAPAIEKLEEEYAEVPDILSGDAGFNNLDMIEEIENKYKTEIITPILPTRRSEEIIQFEYDRQNDLYVCSAGKELTIGQKNRKHKDKLVDVYHCKCYQQCKMRKHCSKSKTGRLIYRYKNEDWRDKYREKMKTDRCKAIINERKSIVEHVFGTIKYWMGQIPLKLRGNDKVITELNLYSIAYNFKRLLNVEKYETILGLINQYSW